VLSGEKVMKELENEHEKLTLIRNGMKIHKSFIMAFSISTGTSNKKSIEIAA
jgi:hypothetical protein